LWQLVDGLDVSPLAALVVGRVHGGRCQVVTGLESAIAWFSGPATSRVVGHVLALLPEHGTTIKREQIITFASLSDVLHLVEPQVVQLDPIQVLLRNHGQLQEKLGVHLVAGILIIELHLIVEAPVHLVARIADHEISSGI